MMKAWVLHDIGDIRFEDVTTPVPSEGRVLVRVKSSGVCGSDIPRVFATGAHRMPIIPGHEFAGVVSGVFDQKDSGLVGRRVGVYPLIPCHNCAPCRDGKYEMCRNYDYLGSRCDGGFAEYVLVPTQNLIEIPDTVPDDAAAMIEPTAVALHAVERGLGEFHLLEYSNLTSVVIGAGPIGLLVGMVLLEKGVGQVTIVGNKLSQRERAENLGMLYHDAAAEFMIKADVVFDCVGTSEAASNTVETAVPEGVVVFVGNPASDMIFPKSTYWKILRNQLRLRGTWNSSRRDWEYVIAAVASGRIAPQRLISHRLAFDDLRHGLDIMHNKTEDYCKVLVEMCE